jgi:Na+-driven multidrug efflux pump
MNNQQTPLSRQFLQYAIPGVIGMLLTSFIPLVDGLFIASAVGQEGLAATTILLPFLYLLLGLTIMAGAGGLSLALRQKGAGDHESANRTFTLTLLTAAALLVLPILAGVLFRNPLLTLLQAGGGLRLPAGEYFGTMIFFYPFMMGNILFMMFIRGEGKPGFSLLFGLAGNGLNILLDWLFIIRFGMGMRGAALASGIAVLLPFLAGMAWFLSGRSGFRFARPSALSPVRDILFNGSSELAGQLSAALVTALFNGVILRAAGITGVAAWTVGGYLLFLQTMVLTGTAQGIAPLASLSLGGRLYDRLRALVRLTFSAALVLGAVTAGVALLLSGPFPRLFADRIPGGAAPEFPAMARTVIRFLSGTFLLNGINILFSMFLTALGDARGSGLISGLRGLVLMSVLVFLLPPFLGLTGIWLCPLLSEAATLIVTLLLVNRTMAAWPKQDNTTEKFTAA